MLSDDSLAPPLDVVGEHGLDGTVDGPLPGAEDVDPPGELDGTQLSLGVVLLVPDGLVLLVPDGEVLLVPDGEVLLVPDGEVLVPDGEVLPVPDGEVLPVPDGEVLLVPDGEVLLVPDGLELGVSLGSSLVEFEPDGAELDEPPEPLGLPLLVGGGVEYTGREVAAGVVRDELAKAGWMVSTRPAPRARTPAAAAIRRLDTRTCMGAGSPRQPPTGSVGG